MQRCVAYNQLQPDNQAVRADLLDPLHLILSSDDPRVDSGGSGGKRVSRW